MSDLPPPPPPSRPPPPPRPPPPDPELVGADAVHDPFVHAGFWQRVGATLIDLLVMILIAVPVVGSLWVLVEVLPRGDWASCTDLDGKQTLCEPLAGPSIAIIVFFVSAVALAFIYWWFGVLVGRKGVTPGRKALGIRVCDMRTGETIGVGRGIGRYAVQVPIGFIPCGGVLDHLWMLWDNDKQTLHDKVVKSIVVRA